MISRAIPFLLASLLAAGTVLLAAPAPAQATRPSTHPVRVCASETRPGPQCVWDARHMGDGRGRSFITVPGLVRTATGLRVTSTKVTISHRRAHRLVRLIRQREAQPPVILRCPPRL